MVLALLGASWTSSASAARGVLSTFGGPGTAAAQFGANAPAGAAVNATGAGGVDPGDLYVADRGGNRIEEFHSDGTFVRAFGLDVGGAGVDVCTATCVAGTSSVAAGGLANPWGVAIDQTTGAVYVSGITNKRIDVFSAVGEFEGAFGFGVISKAQVELQFCTAVTGCEKGLAGAAAGQLGAIQGFLAVAPVGSPHAGDVYVADLSNNRIAEYTPTVSAGEVTGVAFDKAFGGGVADGVSTVLQTCVTICFAGTAGAAPGQFADGAMRGIAVDGNGNVYAVDTGGVLGCISTCRVEKFNAAATSVADFAPARLTFTAGTAQSRAALDVAVDPADGHVFVAQPVSGETHLVEFDPDGDLVEVAGEGSGIPAPATTATGPCLAFGGDGNVYLTSQAATRVYRLNTPPAPGVAISPVTGVGSTSATFNGTVTPVDGVYTRYRFEYSTNGIDWTADPVPDAAAGRGPDPVAIHYAAGELTPNTSYQVRLRADNGTAQTSDVTSFTTGAAPPVVVQEAAAPVSTTGATLTAYVNPQNSPTSYRFEWGPTTAYGNLAPVEFAPFIGSGNQPLRVEAEIGGLEPGAGYHFRLVATSPAGRTEGVDSPFETSSAGCGNEAVRAQASQDPSAGRPFSLSLPECRAYEAVTPSEKGGVDVQLENGPVGRDGNSVGFQTLGATSEPNNFSGANNNPFLAHRTASGWVNSSSFAPAALVAGTYGAGNGAAIYSADLDGVAVCGSPTPSATYPGESVACARRRPDGSWVASPAYPNLTGKVPIGGFLQAYYGASADLSHLVFQATSSDTHFLPTDTSNCRTGCAAGASGLYELVGLGTGSPMIRLIDVDDDGAMIGPAGTTYLGSAAGLNASKGSAYQAVSADGETIYFTATPSGGKPTLYARTGAFAGGTPAAPVTVAISDPSPGECTTCSPVGGLLRIIGSEQVNGFQGASADGSESYFLTTQQLTDADADSTADLYAYDFDEPAGHHIVQVSAGEPDAPTPGAGADVLGVVAISPGGSHVYFAAQGVLTTAPNAAGEVAHAGADNVYSWQRDAAHPGGEVSFLAAVPASDSSLWEPSNLQGPEAQVTPDGRDLVFATAARLAPNDTDQARDIYRYDSQTGALLLISAGTTSLPASIGPFPSPTVFGAQPDVNSLTRAISADGSRIVFSTAEPLVPADTNGVNDVYEWHDGTVSLISDGHDLAGADPRGAALSGQSAPTISPSGSDIFFTTRARLVGTDTDSLADVYDARIGGGFPYRPRASCGDGQSCQGPAGPAPASGVAGSSTWSGPGNPPAPKPQKKQQKKKPKHKKHHKKRNKHRHHKKSRQTAGKTKKGEGK